MYKLCTYYIKYYKWVIFVSPSFVDKLFVQTKWAVLCRFRMTSGTKFRTSSKTMQDDVSVCHADLSHVHATLQRCAQTPCILTAEETKSQTCNVSWGKKKTITCTKWQIRILGDGGRLWDTPAGSFQSRLLLHPPTKRKESWKDWKWGCWISLMSPPMLVPLCSCHIKLDVWFKPISAVCFVQLDKHWNVFVPKWCQRSQSSLAHSCQGRSS